MNYFYRKIDLRSKKAMAEFLSGHVRYDTMSSWNGATSYAHNVKIRNLGLTPAQQDTAYQLLEAGEFRDQVHEVLSRWNEQNKQYGGAFNGRSDGYLVLYRINSPGMGIDMHEDFGQWDMDSLRSRVKLVQSFDSVVDAVRDVLVNLCDHYTVVDETVMVQKIVKVLKPVA